MIVVFDRINKERLSMNGIMFMVHAFYNVNVSSIRCIPNHKRTGDKLVLPSEYS